jgi:putative phosphoesterase
MGDEVIGGVMRIAVISDIHGNLIALEAVLEDLVGEAVDQIVCLGDVALRGPQPQECLLRIRELGCLVVMGNTDEWLIGDEPAWIVPDHDDPVMEIDLWGAAQIDESDRSFIRGFRPTIDVPIGGDNVCFFHGSPRSNTENIFTTTPEAELEAMIAGCEATVLVGGHTHIQMLRRKRAKSIVNVGSVGLPFLRRRGDVVHAPFNAIAPWAEYAIIEHRNGRLGFDLRRALIDLTELERIALENGMPHASWWLSHRDSGLSTSTAMGG